MFTQNVTRGHSALLLVIGLLGTDLLVAGLLVISMGKRKTFLPILRNLLATGLLVADLLAASLFVTGLLVTGYKI